jgi:hypothetical protein
MAEAIKLFPIRPQPGIKRDTTDTEGNFWSVGQWVRFYRGLPRSMLGYRSMTETFPGPSRGLFVNPIGNGFINIFSGTADNLNVGQFTAAGIGANPTDITPAGFAGSPNNVWQFDSIFDDSGSGVVDICAHAAPNLADIANNVPEPVYYGNINAVAPLTASVNDASPALTVTVDGGIVSLPPFLVGYGSNGLFIWSNENDPTVFPVANAANICATKIVKGLSIRGGSNNPSALLWSLDSVIQASYVGGETLWSFNILSDQSSILSSSSPVEMDGIYYWPGVDRWLVFNGVLQELPNEMSLDFFYTNLNKAQSQKVFGFKIPRWGEICWCAPMFGSTECNWIFVYNKRENCWYDSPLPVDGRSAAYFAQTFPYPIMSSAVGLTPIGQNTGVDYPLWQHELNHDQVRGTLVTAIPSNILSPSLSLVGGGLTLFASPAVAPEDVFTELAFMEPDFKFNQNITFNVFGREYPQDTDTLLNTTTMQQMTANNNFSLQVQARYLRWQISVNEQGGYFIMGSPLISYRTGDRSR